MGWGEQRGREEGRDCSPGLLAAGAAATAAPFLLNPLIVHTLLHHHGHDQVSLVAQVRKAGVL